MRPSVLLGVVLLAAAVPQWVLGPTVAGAAFAILASVYAYGLSIPRFSRTETKRCAMRASLGAGAILGGAYGTSAATGLFSLPYAGLELVIASLLLGAVAAGFVGILVLCGLDAAASGRGGYADEPMAG